MSIPAPVVIEYLRALDFKVEGRGVSLNSSVGKTAAGKSRAVTINFKPKKPGKAKLTFKATSSDAGGKTVKKRITVRR